MITPKSEEQFPVWEMGPSREPFQELQLLYSGVGFIFHSRRLTLNNSTVVTTTCIWVTLLLQFLKKISCTLDKHLLSMHPIHVCVPRPGGKCNPSGHLLAPSLGFLPLGRPWIPPNGNLEEWTWIQNPELTHLALFDSNLQMSQFLSSRVNSNTLHRKLFPSHLHLWSHSLVIPQLMIMDENCNIDQLVNRELHLQAQFPLREGHGPMKSTEEHHRQKTEMKFRGHTLFTPCVHNVCPGKSHADSMTETTYFLTASVISTREMGKAFPDSDSDSTSSTKGEGVRFSSSDTSWVPAVLILTQNNRGGRTLMISQNKPNKQWPSQTSFIS